MAQVQKREFSLSRALHSLVNAYGNSYTIFLGTKMDEGVYKMRVSKSLVEASKHHTGGGKVEFLWDLADNYFVMLGAEGENLSVTHFPKKSIKIDSFKDFVAEYLDRLAYRNKTS